MNKTTLYLPDESKKAVEREARQRDGSETRIIREANASAAERRKPCGGLFASGDLLAGRVDELLSGFGKAVIITDTSVLLAYFDPSELRHEHTTPR